MTDATTVSASLATLTANGWSVPNKAPRLSKFSAPLLCTLLGDSITNQCYQEFASGQFSLSAVGYFTHASIKLNGALRLVAELGVPGETSAEILARARAALTQYPSDVLIVLAGTNDFTNASISADTTIANLKAIAALCAEYETICALGTIPPKDTGLDGTINAFASKQAKINWAIMHDIALMPNVVPWDCYSSCVDITTGTWLSGCSTDGTHPIAKGAIRMGLPLADALAPFVPQTYRGFSQPAHQLDGWNLIYNPYMTGNNAAGSNGWTVNTGVTGNGPNGWNAARLVGTPTATAAKVAESGTNMQREWEQLTCSFAADSDCLVVRNDVNQNSFWAAGISPALGTYRRPNTPTGYAYRVIAAGGATGAVEPTNWPTQIGQTLVDNLVTWQCVPLIEAGKRYIAGAEYIITAASGNVSPTMQASCRDNGGAVVADFIGNRRATADPIPDVYVERGVILTPEFIMPANVNRILASCGVYGSAGGSATFQVTGMFLYEIPSGAEKQLLLTSN